MKRKLALAVFTAFAAASTVAAAQTLHTKVAQRDWNPAALEGRCQVRVQVDDRALVRLRGDDLWVETLSGDRAFDLGSSCNQPLPLDRVRDFRITADRGRGSVQETQVPSRRNDFTGTIEVHDPQNGAASYLIDIAWGNATPRYASNEPLPGYDELRACQQQVRSEFARRNAGDATLEFNGTLGRESIGADRQRVYGEAFARNRYSTRQVNYECVLNDRTLLVENVAYNFEGPTRGAMR